LLLQLDTINTDLWEEEEEEEERGACISGRGVQPRELHQPYLKTSNVSIRLNDAKANRILTFPSLPQLLTIDINQGEEEWGVPRSEALEARGKRSE
jgi:hypothetical protein